jgi:hypothetical protein
VTKTSSIDPDTGKMTTRNTESEDYSPMSMFGFGGSSRIRQAKDKFKNLMHFGEKPE